MSSALQPQLLRLEESFEEAKRAGVSVQEKVKVAVLLKCLSGQLRTHVSLQLSEGMSYLELRECLLKWDRAQQRWSHLLPVSSEEVPMEVDRIEQKGKGKKGGKDAKGKGKGEKMARASLKARMAIHKPTTLRRAKARKARLGKVGDLGPITPKAKGRSLPPMISSFTVTSDVTDVMAKVILQTIAVYVLSKNELPTESPESSQSAITTPTSIGSSHVTSGQQTATRIARVVGTVHEESSPVSAVFGPRDNYSSEGSFVRAVQYYTGDSEDDVASDIRAVVEAAEDNLALSLRSPAASQQ